ncbi:MAG: type IV toxin-antitoxin system AbiEi family antitoxin domain-containing protein [Oligoflexia bacterium]|nr:type IV toxin-antitoxin system AbiEi family antitoxin domain-containing protein [Oligoflexia bacterium]
MDRQNRTKLNQLLQNWPRGSVAPTSWLLRQGISRQLLDRYEQYGWVTRVAKGVVIRKGEDVSWVGVMLALQEFLEMSVWVGGKTALRLRGLGHYIPMKKKLTINLYSATLSRLPRWVKDFEKTADFQFQKTQMFSEKLKTIKTFSDYEEDKLKIKISTPERAVFEMLESVPSTQSFEEAELIFENLANMRPQVLQSHLQLCRSVKAKRLFLYLAEKSGHTWFLKLNTSKIDLGKGKRAIVPHGKLDSKYQIIVPR